MEGTIVSGPKLSPLCCPTNYCNHVQDFEGQKTSERIARYGLIVSAVSRKPVYLDHHFLIFLFDIQVIAYFIGLRLGSVKYSMFTFGFGFLVVLLVRVSA